MLHKINTFKADFYNVFVKGEANSLQMARVFMILAVPVMIAFITGAHAIKY